MGFWADEQVRVEQTLKGLELPNRRLPVPDSPGGGWAPRRRTYFQAQLRLHISRKTRARKERLLRQEAAERIAQLRAGERRKPEPARPYLPRAARPDRLTFPSTSRHSPSAISRILYMSENISSSARGHRPARHAAPGGVEPAPPFPARARRTRPPRLPGRSRPRGVPQAPTPPRSRKGRRRPLGPRQRRRPSSPPPPAPLSPARGSRGSAVTTHG